MRVWAWALVWAWAGGGGGSGALGERAGSLCSRAGQGRSCTHQILDGNHDHLQSCWVKYFPNNSTMCDNMEFGPITDNRRIGDVKLEPYIYEHRDGIFRSNYTVLNITFTNIKWNDMKFRFERSTSKNTLKNHCRNIKISSNVTVKDQSVMYYDCWWSEQDSIYVGEDYILDFEAEGDSGVKRGQYYFVVPSLNMLDPTVRLQDWQPFMYIEFSASPSLILHVNPAPSSLGIEKYRMEIVKECVLSEGCPSGKQVLHRETLLEKNGEVTYEYALWHQSGSYYFVVTPLHKDRLTDPDKICKSSKSPTISISNDHPATVVCIASIAALVVATLFAYYIALRLLRRYWCKDYKLTSVEDSIVTPPRILVVYSPTNKLHTECVTSFVNYLRYECGLHVMYDCDISSTAHGDPSIWCTDAFKIANYILYIASPVVEPQENSAFTPHCKIDVLQLNLLKASRAAKFNKQVVNVVFEHSQGTIPAETQNDRTFYLLKDWQKLIGFLSMNIVPKQQLQRTEKGRCLLDDLKRAKKYMGNKTTFGDVVIKCENIELGGVVDKKVLL